MRALRLLLVLPFLVNQLIVGEARAQDKFPDVPSAPVKTTFKIAGGEIGENVYTLDGSGAFTSVTHAKIGPASIDSTLEGKWEKGKIVFAKLKQSQGTQSLEVTFDHGKIHAVGPNGKPVDFDSGYKGSAFFSTFHPQIWGSCIPASGEVKSEKIMVLEGPAVVDFPISMSSPRTFFKEKLTSFSFSLTGIKIDVLARPDHKIAYFNVPVQKFSGVMPGYEGLAEDSMAKFPELSQGTMAVTQELSTKVKMRDGTVLVTDVVRPKDSAKHPAILVRTPYGRGSETMQGAYWASRGYVYVTQDCRGRGESGGSWDPFQQERKDGFDTIAWIAEQDWSNARVGMIGGSYVGLVQWAAAIENPPALKCIIPQVSPPPPFLNIPYENGAFFLAGDIWWSFIVRGKDADFSSLKKIPSMTKLTTLPLSKLDDAVIGKDVPFFNRWLERDTPAKWTDATTLPEIAKVQIPVLHISGTWDGDGVGTKLHWETLVKAGKQNQWLVFGPWEHGFNVSQKHADVDYGPQSLIDLDSVYLRFFDTYLKERSVGWEKTPKVRLFETGVNKWVNLSGWPDASWHSKTLFLNASGQANGLKTGGHLTLQPKTSSSSRYVYDPAKLKLDGKEAAPEDASTKLPAKRITNDQLFFRTDSFGKDTTIAGPVNVTLFISSTVRDATFHAVILDQDRAGVLRIVGMPGVMRATFADGTGVPKLLTPGKVYKLNIRPWWFAHQFGKGHRMVLMVTSNLFPQFARNPGTGEPDATATKMLRATQTIYHDAKHPSSIEFEIVK